MLTKIASVCMVRSMQKETERTEVVSVRLKPAYMVKLRKLAKDQRDPLGSAARKLVERGLDETRR